MWVIAIHKRLRVNAEQNCIFSNKIHLPKFGISVVHDCEKYVTLFFFLLDYNIISIVTAVTYFFAFTALLELFMF
jgi:hypothetical protein